MKQTIKIAIIDDHLIFLKGLSMLLEQEEHFKVIYICNTYSELMKNLQSDVPDILISDISMPEINGIELSKRIKNHHPEIKILMMSSYSDMVSADEVDGYLLKDTDSETLIESIKKIVRNGAKVFYKDFQPVREYDFSKNIVSKREREIISCIGKGFTTDEIAEKLFISKHTVETHRKNIFNKLQVNNIAALVKKSIILGLLDV